MQDDCILCTSHLHMLLKLGFNLIWELGFWPPKICSMQPNKSTSNAHLYTDGQSCNFYLDSTGKVWTSTEAYQH